MKLLNNDDMTLVIGGGYTAGFCSAISGIRAGIGIYNAAVTAGLLAAGTATIATGGLAISIIVGACAVYGTGNAFGWWGK
jgi:hypothetical protein